MRLENVRSFASTVDRELGPAQINSLVLNAGVLFPNDDTRSADGFEAAFAVNHLAHYLLCGFCCLGLRKAPPSF
jgi:NAD(P)-dependent dehydrogenase (short-subunit alcohol dehydrogenase family)